MRLIRIASIHGIDAFNPKAGHSMYASARAWADSPIRISILGDTAFVG